ncbi:MAG TPA: CAP domain-containing protein [Hyphomonadaceae bacterium]|nr:CAP domain-containing protein [Hyphomonadaceae bacterium]
MRLIAMKGVLAAVALALASPATAQNVAVHPQAVPAIPSVVTNPAGSQAPRNGKPMVEPAAMEGMLAAQNGARQRIGLPPLTWSSDLASKADASASAAATVNCSINSTMRASAAEGTASYWAAGLSRLGGTASIQNIVPSFLVSEWVAGQADYDLARHTCRRSGACDQYARMVSPAARQVGCARAICPSQAQVWICRYDDSAPPAGSSSGSPGR